ncbi:MAG: hypothetical protein KDE15_06210 [Erythrobacter sp.]|nr:hypothetical protein [Erythrobacter sp.]
MAVPAMAAEAPVRAPGYAQVQTGDPGVVNQYRYRGYRPYRRHRVDGGDVVAGVLVFGALAAILSSADNNRRERERYDDRRPQPRYDQRDYDRRDYDRRDYGGRDSDSRGIQNAVDMCLDQVERGDERAESVDEARRGPDGWYVSGALRGGSGWQCWIDNDGRIRNVDIGRGGYSQAGDGDYYASNAGARGDGQLSDDTYARARAATRAQSDGSYSYDRAPAADGSAQPAYPGGPLPGEEGYGDDDGRYSTAQAPDFRQPGY